MKYSPRSSVVVVLAVSTATLAIALLGIGWNSKSDGWSLVFERPSRGKYEDFSFPTESEGWATTATGDILHSSNRGKTWTSQATNLGVVRSVDFLDKHRGFAGTLDGRLYYTESGGSIWLEISKTLPHAARGFCGITHVASDVHIVGRYVGRITDYFVSRDAGATWTYSDLHQLAQALVDIAFVSRDTGFIGGMSNSAIENQGQAIILKTVDGGRSWRPVFVDNGGRGFAWKIWAVSTLVLYASLQSQDGTYRIAKSSDGGNSWETLIVAEDRPEGVGIQSVGFLSEREGWVGGFFRGLYATKDGGSTWKLVAETDSLVNRFERVGSSLITGSTRGILRRD